MEVMALAADNEHLCGRVALCRDYLVGRLLRDGGETRRRGKAWRGYTADGGIVGRC